VAVAIIRSTTILWTALDVARHQSRCVAVEVSRARLNFRLFRISALTRLLQFGGSQKARILY
jgi:hypothetical protein